MVLSYIPSPAQGVWYLGPLPIRAYALCIIAGILVAVFWTRRRWQAAGHNPDDIVDVALWAVPFGIVGDGLYHVVTDPELYFAPGEQPIRALYIWDGGLGIWAAAREAVGVLQEPGRGEQQAEHRGVAQQAAWRAGLALTCLPAALGLAAPLAGGLAWPAGSARGGSPPPAWCWPPAGCW